MSDVVSGVKTKYTATIGGAKVTYRIPKEYFYTKGVTISDPNVDIRELLMKGKGKEGKWGIRVGEGEPAAYVPSGEYTQEVKIPLFGTSREIDTGYGTTTLLKEKVVSPFPITKQIVAGKFKPMFAIDIGQQQIIQQTLASAPLQVGLQYGLQAVQQTALLSPLLLTQQRNNLFELVQTVRPIQAPAVEQMQKLETGAQVGGGTVQRQRQLQETIQEIPVTPVTPVTPVIPPTPPPTPPVWIPDDDLKKKKEKKEKKKKFEEEYIAKVKKKGKFVAVSAPTTRARALQIGEAVTRQTAAATFKVEKTGRKIPRRFGVGIGSPSAMFRGYKIREGKAVPLADTFIQKRAYRIATPGEKAEITLLGQKARKRKAAVRRGRRAPKMPW